MGLRGSEGYDPRNNKMIKGIKENGIKIKKVYVELIDVFYSQPFFLTFLSFLAAFPPLYLDAHIDAHATTPFPFVTSSRRILSDSAVCRLCAISNSPCTTTPSSHGWFNRSDAFARWPGR